MAETQSPIEALRLALNKLSVVHAGKNFGCHCVICDATRKALAEVEAVVATAWRDHRDATGHLRPGELGVVNLDTYASMGCKSCAALVPFGKEGP